MEEFRVVLQPAPSSSSPSLSASLWRPELGLTAAAADSRWQEHMFDKVVTPSDVGKLNRLVIPKQYAERFFPLEREMADKGVVLCFEDAGGERWSFRYSYWHSSQSYVMTKGWSRFVKEKRLDAGDAIAFGRGVGEPGQGRLYIDWKRRPESRPLRGISFGHFFMPPPLAAVVGYNAASSPSTNVQQVVFFQSPAALRPVQVDPPPDNGRQARDKGVWLFGVNLLASQADAGGSSDFISSLESPAAALRPVLHMQHNCVESSQGSSSSLDLDS